MRVDVTQVCLDEGVRFSPQNCAVAIAVQLSWSTPTDVVVVDPYLIKVRDKLGQCWVAKLPLEVSDYITDYDLAKSVKPQSFELEFTPDADDRPIYNHDVPMLPPGTITGHMRFNRYRKST